MNSMEQQVYYAFEKSGTCMRICCGPGRGFTLHIVDNSNQVCVEFGDWRTILLVLRKSCELSDRSSAARVVVGALAPVEAAVRRSWRFKHRQVF